MSRVLVFLISILVPFSVNAWTSRTYQIIVVQSTKLMPSSFQRIVKTHKEQILRGSLKPDDLDESAHQYDLKSKSGFLQDRILELIRNIPQKIHDHRPFKEVIEDYGRLAHYIADLNDPLILEDSDPKESQYRKDFAIYTEKNIDKFPWIFDGHEDQILNRNDLREYIYEMALRASSKYARLGEAYFPDGQLVSSDTFDPKSLPFGIASLSYSHSISNTVQIWFYTWKQAHGDLTYTPLYKHNGVRK